MQLITISDGLIGAMDVPHQIHLCEAKKGHLLYAIEQAQKNYTDNLEKLLTITKPAIHLLGSPRSSGKTEITKRLLATNPLLKQVLNYTTRKKRGEEAATHHFVEHLPIGCYEYEYTGAKYGYVFEDIEDVLLQKRDVLLVVTPYEVFNDITNRMGRKEALNLLQVYSILMDQRAMQEQITATREGVENDPHINEEYEKYTKDTFAQMVHTIPNINTGADNKYGLYAALNSIQHLFTQHRHL
jgi:guanylate kinase